VRTRQALGSAKIGKRAWKTGRTGSMNSIPDDFLSTKKTIASINRFFGQSIFLHCHFISLPESA